MLWDLVSGIAIGAVAGVVLLAIGTGISRFCRWIDHINAALVEINTIHRMLQQGEWIRERENRTNPPPRPSDHQFYIGPMRRIIQNSSPGVEEAAEALTSSTQIPRSFSDSELARMISQPLRASSLPPKQAPSSPDLIEQLFQQVWHRHQMYSTEDDHDRS